MVIEGPKLVIPSFRFIWAYLLGVGIREYVHTHKTILNFRVSFRPPAGDYNVYITVYVSDTE